MRHQLPFPRPSVGARTTDTARDLDHDRLTEQNPRAARNDDVKMRPTIRIVEMRDDSRCGMKMASPLATVRDEYRAMV